jgi:hypothetical protein
MLSQKKQMQISEIILANVAADFAFMMNPKYRGSKFTWDDWLSRIETSCEIWLGMHMTGKILPEYIQFARKRGKEFANNLVRYAHE